jgi:hypothetical protein
MRILNPVEKLDENRNPRVSFSKLVWTEEKADQFHLAVSSAKYTESMTRAKQLIDTDADAALDTFNQALLSASSCMSETIVLGGKRFIGVQPWFDLECKQAKIQAKHALRMLRLKHTEECKTVY